MPPQTQVLLLSFFTLFSIAFSTPVTNPLYSIAAPNTLRPNNPYQLLITVHDAESAVHVKIRLGPARGEDQSKVEPLLAEEALEKGETKLIELKVGAWDQGRYELTAIGSGGVTFNKTVGVSYRDKTFSIFIQTDKATYKPGQTVHFRVLAVDETLKPIDTNNATVYIEDSRRNRVKQWNEAKFTNGVFGEDFQLSDQVVLGDWKIIARVKHLTERKEFSVKEYVLPRFEVKIEPPSFVNYNKPKGIIKVTASYTYGKPLKGQLYLNVTDYYCKYPCISSYVKLFSYNTTIDGEAEVPVDFVNDLTLPTWMQHGNRLAIRANVVEELSGQEQTGEGEVQIHNSDYNFDFTKSDTYKPGLPYSIKLTATMRDGKPIQSPITNVTVKCSDGPATLVHVSKDIPVDGDITLDFTTPEESTGLQCEAHCEHGSAYAYISKARSLSNRYIELSMSKTNFKVGDEAEFKIESTSELTDPILVSVIGRGKILKWMTVQPSYTKHQTFSLKVAPEMIPKARVVAYYVTFCGEVISDAADFSVDGVFKTEVDLTLSATETSPGSPFDVKVSTHPNAFVGFLAVDKKVLLMNPGNDLTTDQVLNDLQGYEIGELSYYRFDRRKRSTYWIAPWRPTATTTLAMFSQVGLNFLTNCLLVQDGNYYRPYDHTNRFATAEMSGMAGRPGMAGMPAASAPRGGPAHLPLVEPERVRSLFPETFLWVNGTTAADGTLTVKAVAPDDITSYQITAFALDKDHGLGLTKSPVSFNNFQPFFLVLNLPYSIVRGEVLALQVMVFNYLKEDVEAHVTLDNKNGNFYLAELDNTVELDTPHAKEETKTVKVKANDAASVTFLLAAKKLGHIDIEITAKTTVAADAVRQKLLVKAEGITKYISSGVFVDLKGQPKQESKLSVKIEDAVVPDSEYVEASAITDIMGSTVNNLDKLLRLPTGCGEQTLSRFVPNIVILDYLTKTNKLTPAIKERAVHFIESGYQRMLTFKRLDNSFGVFQSDKFGSTWLTAFVVKSFLQSKRYITIDDDVVKYSLDWLARTQRPDGNFEELGSHWSSRLQGGLEKQSLTAYVLTAFLESKKHGIDVTGPNNTNIDNIIKNAVHYLETKLQFMVSDYDLVITTYALHLAGSSSKDEAYNLMNKRSKSDQGLTYWSVPQPKQTYYYYYRAPAIDVETTAYALLTYMLRGEHEQAFPIVRWLVSKRNENGGFESTQDTVMGIRALAKFAEKLSSADEINLDLTFGHGAGEEKLHLSNENALVLQTKELPKNTKEVAITATGKGAGIAQVTWAYNTLTFPKQPAFEVSTMLTAKQNCLSVKACARYVGESGVSDMAVLEVGLPSGFTIDKENLPQVGGIEDIKKVDTKHGDTVMLVYFNSIGPKVCVTANAHRAFRVANPQEAVVEVYDYYDPVKRGETTYKVPEALSLCDLCNNLDCKPKQECS